MRATAVEPISLDRLEAAIQAMIARGFAALQIPSALHDLAERVRHGWRRFVLKPREYKSRFTIQSVFTDPKEGPDDGWISRFGESVGVAGGGAYDAGKQFFHWRTGLAGDLRTRKVVHEADEVQWFKDCAAFDVACRDLLLRIYCALDAVLPGFNFAARHFAVGDMDPDSVIRMLYYPPPEHWGMELGKLHVDRNTITLHVAESAPGCVLHDADSETMLHCRPDMIVIFAGRKAQLITGGKETAIMGNSKPVVEGGLIRALPHRIMVLKGTSLAESRDSLVYFGHCRMETPVAV
ncbi:MAG: hypothetical protein Q7R62_01930 [bacterium]|nr:hypothetical protein [bacterium]